MKIQTERFLLGEILGHRLTFTSEEQGILRRAGEIAERAREMKIDEDSDTLLAEIEHGCRELLEDPKGYRVEVGTCDHCGPKE